MTEKLLTLTVSFHFQKNPGSNYQQCAIRSQKPRTPGTFSSQPRQSYPRQSQPNNVQFPVPKRGGGHFQNIRPIRYTSPPVPQRNKDVYPVALIPAASAVAPSARTVNSTGRTVTNSKGGTTSGMPQNIVLGSGSGGQTQQVVTLTQAGLTFTITSPQTVTANSENRIPPPPPLHPAPPPLTPSPMMANRGYNHATASQNAALSTACTTSSSTDYINIAPLEITPDASMDIGGTSTEDSAYSTFLSEDGANTSAFASANPGIQIGDVMSLQDNSGPIGELIRSVVLSSWFILWAS